MSVCSLWFSSLFIFWPSKDFRIGIPDFMRIFWLAMSSSLWDELSCGYELLIKVMYMLIVSLTLGGLLKIVLYMPLERLGMLR